MKSISGMYKWWLTGNYVIQLWKTSKAINYILRGASSNNISVIFLWEEERAWTPGASQSKPRLKEDQTDNTSIMVICELIPGLGKIYQPFGMNFSPYILFFKVSVHFYIVLMILSIEYNCKVFSIYFSPY